LAAALVGVCAAARARGEDGKPPAPAPQAPAACVELKRLVGTTYNFRPSKVTAAVRTAKGKDMDRVWAFAEAHAAEVVPCLREMLEAPDAGSFFRFDGASLLVKLDPSPASKSLEARLWSDAMLEDIDLRIWVQTLAHLALDGIDVSKAGRRWLTTPGLKYFLPEHGAYEVTSYDGAVFLFGAMDEALARPVLIDIARDPKHPGRLNALWLLLVQATPEAREALRTLPLDGIPAEARSGIAKTIAGVPPANQTPYQTIPTFTRAELLSAFAARDHDDRAAYDKLIGDPRFADSGAQVLLPADETQVRLLRRHLVSRCNQHGLDDYIVLSTLLAAMQNRARHDVARAAPVPADRAVPSSSPGLAAFDVPAAQLPAGVTLTAGEPACVSIQPLTFFAHPTAPGIPTPRARRALVMRRGARSIGSALMFEYQPGEIPKVRQFLDGLLWGEERSPSREHPEEIAVAGNTLLILCLQGEDPAFAWYKERLYQRHHARVTRICDGLGALKLGLDHREDEGEVTAAEAERRVFYRNEKALLECNLGASLLGELARSGQDWPRAEKAFRRAIELDQQGDLFPRLDAEWGARDGLALSVAMQGRLAESVPLFETALALARKLTDPTVLGSAQYNLACAYAEVGKFSEAAETLKAAIKIDPKYKKQARTDDSFRKALAEPPFKWLGK
jgi:hypothetical protein